MHVLLPFVANRENEIVPTAPVREEGGLVAFGFRSIGLLVVPAVQRVLQPFAECRERLWDLSVPPIHLGDRVVSRETWRLSRPRNERAQTRTLTAPQVQFGEGYQAPTCVEPVDALAASVPGFVELTEADQLTDQLRIRVQKPAVPLGDVGPAAQFLKSKGDEFLLRLLEWGYRKFVPPLEVKSSFLVILPALRPHPR